MTTNTAGFDGPRKISRLLIANRGEIAIRIARACAELGVETVAVAPQDDTLSLHFRKCDRAAILPGKGVAAYLDGPAIIAVAKAEGCDAIHPGYGFLSESAQFAQLCIEAGLVFIGPSVETLAAFGDKTSAIAAARNSGLAVAAGLHGSCTLEQAAAFMRGLPDAASIMVKAVAGGGGRGMRVVARQQDLADAWKRCAAEALAAFANADLYVEEYIARARHIEVQVAGDVHGDVAHLFERECSAQRRHQKLVEIAPSPWLPKELRDRLTADAVRLAQDARYVGVGTVEFLVELDQEGRATGRYVFVEMNPRLQVEHTVTEEALQIDLVRGQIEIACGRLLEEIGFAAAMRRGPVGHAMQLRINSEVLAPDGSFHPAGGMLTAFNPPAGRGVRLETAAYAGLKIHSGFDSLLAKLVIHSPDNDFDALAARARHALREFQIEGVETNLPLLQKLLHGDDFRRGRVDTGYIDRSARALAADGVDVPALHPALPAHSISAETQSTVQAVPDIPGLVAFRVPMGGTVTQLHIEEGGSISASQPIAVIEAMKMETTLAAFEGGEIERILVAVGDAVQAGDALYLYFPAAIGSEAATAGPKRDDSSREVIEELRRRKQALLDENRAEAMARLARRGALSARARIAALCDEASFQEIGGLVRPDYSDGDAPADGMIMGTARIDGRAVAVIAQDYSVFGGSTGHLGGAKLDRAARLALQAGIPLVMLLDGGGHRIQDGQSSRHYADGAGTIMQELAHLSGWAPIVSAVMGFGFAGNTNFSSFADLVVMVRNRSTMGIAGPALVKVATGEAISAEALGGADIQVRQNGLADLGVDTEDEAFAAIRRFLSYLPTNASLPPPVRQAMSSLSQAERMQALAQAIPANSKRSYDIRSIIELIADEDSVYEKKPEFAGNIVTAFARLDGRPVGFIANQPLVAGGMLDAAACEKGAHFIATCDAYGLPVIYLIDVPGAAVGSLAERTVLGRRSAKLMQAIGQATVPRISIVLRKGYGMGYVAMGGGRTFEPDAVFAWPTAEICAMSIEGATDVAYRKDYEAAPDPGARRKEIIEEMRRNVSAFKAAEGFGIDDVIDPCTTRERLIEVLSRAPARRVTRRPPKFRSIPPI